MKNVCIVLLGMALLLGTGCSRTREFRVQFIDRDSSEIAGRADGTELGRVASGGAVTFSFEARVLDYSGTNGGPYAASVTFSAYSIRSGRSTRSIPRTVYTDKVETVEINPGDFY